MVSTDYSKSSPNSQNYSQSAKDGSVLLLEDGGKLLLESGGAILLEESTRQSTNMSKGSINSTNFST